MVYIHTKRTKTANKRHKLGEEVLLCHNTTRIEHKSPTDKTRETKSTAGFFVCRKMASPFTAATTLSCTSSSWLHGFVGPTNEISKFPDKRIPMLVLAQKKAKKTRKVTIKLHNLNWVLVIFSHTVFS